MFSYFPISDLDAFTVLLALIPERSIVVILFFFSHAITGTYLSVQRADRFGIVDWS